MADDTARPPHAIREADTFLALAETLSALIALIQGDKLIYVNPAGAAILGYPRDSYKGRNFWEFAIPEEQDAIRERGRNRQLGVDYPRRFLERLRHADGRAIWVDYSVDVIELDGKLTTLVTGQDISDHKRTEESLRMSEALFRQLFTQSPVMICSVDKQDRLWKASDHWLKKLGYTQEEVLGTNGYQYLTPDSIQRFASVLQEKIKNKEWLVRDVPLQTIRKDGSLMDILVTSVAKLNDRGEHDGWISVAQDISEINEAHKALSQSEERFRAAFENAAIGKAITGADFRLQKVNRAFCDMVGYTEEELLAISPIELTHPGDREATKALALKILSGDQDSGRQIKRYVHRKGHEVWVDMTTTIVRTADRKPSYFVTEVIDITERKRAEELLKDREAKLAESQRIAKIGRWEWDVDADKVTWSDQIYEIYGVEPSKFRGTYHDVFSRMPEDDRERIGALVAEAARTGRPAEYEHRVRHDDGTVRHVWSSCITVTDA